MRWKRKQPEASGWVQNELGHGMGRGEAREEERRLKRQRKHKRAKRTKTAQSQNSSGYIGREAGRMEAKFMGWSVLQHRRKGAERSQDPVLVRPKNLVITVHAK